MGDMKKVLLFFIMLFILQPVAAERQIFIEITIIPQGVVTTEYNVVGDIFTYNISLYNNNSEVYADNLSIEITAPGERNISRGGTIYTFTPQGVTTTFLPISTNISIEGHKSESLVPQIDQSRDNRIWQFDVAGDYSIRICSSNPEVNFIKWYNPSIDSTQHSYPRYYYTGSCFNYYFSAMPKWQYDLFKKNFAAAQESLDANKKSLEASNKSLEANEKLLDLNIDLDRATKSMLWASWLMFAVALLTLYISASDDVERKKWHHQFIRETVLSFLAPIILLVFLGGFVLINFYFFKWVGLIVSLILIIVLYCVEKRKQKETSQLPPRPVVDNF